MSGLTGHEREARATKKKKDWGGGSPPGQGLTNSIGSESVKRMGGEEKWNNFFVGW